MRKIFITYADDNFKESLLRIKKEAEETGVFDEIKTYTPNDLPQPFLSYTQNYERGGGYWLWKPYIIKHTLDKADDGDVVVYADAGCTLYRHEDWQRYFQLVKKKEELFFIAPGKNRRWCKSEIYHFFGIKKRLFDNAKQIQATFIIAKKKNCNEVIQAWYETASKNHELFTDAKNKAAEDPKFVEHRHDQAVLTACVCTAAHPWYYRLLTEKLERRYDAGQAVFASRISKKNKRCTFKRQSRIVSLFSNITINPLTVLFTRLLYIASSRL